MPKSSRKIKMSQKQKQSTKQSVIVNVKNVINERRRRAKPAPKKETKDTRDTVTLQPKASMFGNNLLTGNVSRYVQPALSFAVSPPQFQPIQSAIMDKPIAKVVPPKQQPDIFAGEETNPQDIVPSYTPKATPILPDNVFKMQKGIEQSFATPSLPMASSSSSGFIYAPQPPPPPSMPREDMGSAQAIGAPAIPMAQAILPEEKEASDWVGDNKASYFGAPAIPIAQDILPEEKDEVVPQAGAPPEGEAGETYGKEAVKEWIRQSSGKKYGLTPTNATMRNWLEENIYGGRGNFPENIQSYTAWARLGTDQLQKLLYENRGQIKQGAMKDSNGKPWPWSI